MTNDELQLRVDDLIRLIAYQDKEWSELHTKCSKLDKEVCDMTEQLRQATGKFNDMRASRDKMWAEATDAKRELARVQKANEELVVTRDELRTTLYARNATVQSLQAQLERKLTGSAVQIRPKPDPLEGHTRILDKDNRVWRRTDKDWRAQDSSSNWMTITSHGLLAFGPLRAVSEDVITT